MFDRFRSGSRFRFVVLTISALVALPGCADEIGGDDGEGDGEEVEATDDPLIAPGESGWGGNMLSNPGFETALSSTNWWLGSTWNDATLRTGAARHYGSYGLRLSGRLAWMIHKEVGTSAGARYAISAYARRTAYGTTPCWMEVQFYPNGGLYKTASVSTTDWKPYGVSAVAPAGTTSARVQIKRDSGSASATNDACDWDDFSFRRVY